MNGRKTVESPAHISSHAINDYKSVSIHLYDAKGSLFFPSLSLMPGRMLPSEDAAVVLRFSLVVSGQIKLRRIDGWRMIGGVLSQQRGRAA